MMHVVARDDLAGKRESESELVEHGREPELGGLGVGIEAKGTVEHVWRSAGDSMHPRVERETWGQADFGGVAVGQTRRRTWVVRRGGRQDSSACGSRTGSRRTFSRTGSRGRPEPDRGCACARRRVRARLQVTYVQGKVSVGHDNRHLDIGTFVLS